MAKKTNRPPNAPSTTGNPSGGKRGDNPPKPSTPVRPLKPNKK